MSESDRFGALALHLVRQEALACARTALDQGGRFGDPAHWNAALLTAGFMRLAMCDAGRSSCYEHFAALWTKDFGPDGRHITLPLYLAACTWHFSETRSEDEVANTAYRAIDAALMMHAH